MGPRQGVLLSWTVGSVPEHVFNRRWLMRQGLIRLETKGTACAQILLGPAEIFRSAVLELLKQTAAE